MSEQSQKKLSQQEVVRLERDLAKFANMMDSVVRIPFMYVLIRTLFKPKTSANSS